MVNLMTQMGTSNRINKTAVVCVGIIAIAATLCVYFYTNSNRYVTANGGKGAIYRIDRKTGKSVMLDGDKEYPVEPRESEPETPSKRAIRLAKAGYTLDKYPIENESAIRSEMKKQTGHLRIGGWKAKRIDDQTYVVTYSYEAGENVTIHTFEVNLEADIVRVISLDGRYKLL